MPGLRTRYFQGNQKPRLLKALLLLSLSLFLIFFLSSPTLAAAYFSANSPILFPNTASVEATSLELFMDNRDCLYALNYPTGELTVFNSQGILMNNIQLPLTPELRKTAGYMWIESGKIYLKPSSDGFVWLFNLQGEFIGKIKLKTSGDGYYNFTDIVADPRGYIYVIDGNSLEIKVFDPSGNLQGIFAKRSGRANDLPGWPECFFLDKQGTFYICARLVDSNKSQIVKYSYEGRLLARYSDPIHHYTAIWVDDAQNLYAISPEDSVVVKYDQRGQKIFEFWAESWTGLAVNHQETVYLDSHKGRLINLYLPSRVAKLIDQGNRALEEEVYDQAETRFQQALALNNQLTYLHSILGEVYFHQRRWTQAMAEFSYLRDNWRYSQSLTNFRNDLLVNEWPFLLAALLGLIGLLYLLGPWLRKAFSLPIFVVFKVFYRPRDTLQNTVRRLGLLPAWVLIFGLVLSKYLSWYYTNPIFISERQVFSFQIFGRNLFMVVALVLIWSWAAFKVGELFQGMAAYSHILAGTAVCLIPLLIGYPILALLSHLLTYQEIWIYQWLIRIIIGWVILLFILMLKFTEEFDWSKTLGVGLANLAATGLTLIFISFLVGVNQQLWGFLKDIFNELYNRITT